MHPFLFFESIGTSELLVILVVALVVFGPRKLPELGRSLGRSINEFKRASDDLKRTWEREVELEQAAGRDHTVRAALPETSTAEQPAEAAAAACGEAEGVCPA